jgi:hypothetical protein
MGEAGRIAAVWLGLASVVALSALPHIDDIGLYYDEAFMAAQARDFVGPESGGLHPGSVRSVELFGRPFPVRNAAYLGSLKSQLLIPSLALFGSSVDVLRITTLATGLIALLLTMLFAGRVFGTTVAMIGGALIATDPGFYFLSQFEWGPFTTNLLCRAAGFWLFAIAWQSQGRGRALAAAAGAGLALGLGVFSRADFALILAACVLAVGLCHREQVMEALRTRRSVLMVGAGALFIGALPMLGSALALIRSSGAIADRGGLAYKSAVLWTVLDGSHFMRLMETGGLFDEIFAVDAPSGLFGLVAIAAALYLASDIVLRDRHEPAGGAFLLTATLLVAAGMLVLPGAVRAHHQLNTMPFVQLLVATAAVSAWRRAWPSERARRVARALSALALALAIGSNVAMILRTQSVMEEAGGRGRWTRQIHALAEDLDARGSQVAVSLDWGFHEPLMFLTRHTKLVEPIWAIPKLLRSSQPWVFDGGAETLYLVHDAPYDLFGLGPDFLRAVGELEPDEAQVVDYRALDGELAFKAVRILRPHRIIFRGRFEIRRRLSVRDDAHDVGVGEVRLAAVDVEGVPGHPARIGPCEIERKARDVGGQAGATQRNGFQVALADSGMSRQRGGERCLDQPRSDPDDAHALRRDLERRAARQHVDGGLRRAVGRHAPGRHLGVDRRDVDDNASARLTHDL